MRGWTISILGVLVALPLAGLAWGGLPLVDRSDDSHGGSSSGTTVNLALDLAAYQCTFYPDGICLGFNGVTPGPTIVTHEGDTLVVTVTNRVPETIAPLTASAALKARLSAASLSFHTHGVTITPENDGVGAHPGTNLIDSSVAPNATRVYTLQTMHAGTWHYHDHVLGPDGGEGQGRGLFGTLRVLPPGESTTVFDLHVLNSGPNGGRGMTGTIGAGQRFDLAVVGLGDYWWNVKLLDDTNTVIRETDVGPGVSDAFIIDAAAAGTYTWRAKTIFLAPTYTGTVTAS